MKMVKSLLLGAAAGLVAVAGAQAADLPVKAKPVQYVKICSLYGAGFYYMPGTDTCLKVGGWVRAEINVNSGGSFNPFKNVNFDTRNYDKQTTRSRGIITLDARSQTEYGTLRAYIAGGFQYTSSRAGGTGDFNQVYAPRAFIQWAGFTAGFAQSFFDFYVTPAYSHTTNVLGSDTGGAGDFVFAYTAQFGNGLSATISAEDPGVRRVGISGDTYGGRQWMDIVGNLRIDQAWGSAQVMGAFHEVRTTTGISSDEFGYALGAGVTVNLPMISKGDSISAQFTYGKGALRYVGGGLAHFAITDGGTTGVGAAYDAVVVGTDTDLTSGWSIVGGFKHVWTPQWNTTLYGTYGSINYSDAASLTVGGATDGDWSYWQAGSRTTWTPVQNLDLSVDIMYNKLDTAYASLGAEDQGWWQGIFRVQRNFYP
jgi:hypothetical protein